jgi:hypothetical protein
MCQRRKAGDVPAKNFTEDFSFGIADLRECPGYIDHRTVMLAQLNGKPVLADRLDTCRVSGIGESFANAFHNIAIERIDVHGRGDCASVFVSKCVNRLCAVFPLQKPQCFDRELTVLRIGGSVAF